MKISRIRLAEINSKRKNRLFKKCKINQNIVNYHGNDLMKNSHIGAWNSFLFKAVDKMSPIIKKHPKLGAKIIRLTEKMVKNTSDFKI